MRRQRRCGLTLFQLLIVLAILAILLGLLLPAVAKVKMAASRTQSVTNLKQLALALHVYHSVHNVLPPGVNDNHFSTAFHLLPYIEQDNLYKLTDTKKEMEDKANDAVRKVQVRTFLSPRDPLQRVKDDCGATNYLFNDLAFFLNSKATLPRTFLDGTSNTVAIGETLKGDGKTDAVDVKRQHVLLDKAALKGLKPDVGEKYFKDNKNIAGDRCACWMDGRFLQGTFNGQLKLNDPWPDVSCAGAGGVSALRSLDQVILVALADGSVRSLNAQTLTHRTWLAALTPNGGEVLGVDW